MTDRTTPPSDAAMGKVVEKWKGWDFLSGDDPNIVRFEYGRYTYRTPGGFMIADTVADPRTDPDAALELLHWLVIEEVHGPIYPQMSGGYYVGTSHDIRSTSGQPFRTAVCWLAVDVLGVEG